MAKAHCVFITRYSSFRSLAPGCNTCAIPKVTLNNEGKSSLRQDLRSFWIRNMVSTNRSLKAKFLDVICRIIETTAASHLAFYAPHFPRFYISGCLKRILLPGSRPGFYCWSTISLRHGEASRGRSNQSQGYRGINLSDVSVH